MQHVAFKDLQGVEQLYDIKFRFENANLVIENCPDKISKLIESKVNVMLASKYTKTADLGILPGIQQIIQADGSTINADIQKLEGINYYFTFFP